jgi:alkaline phosphatase D
MRRLLFLALAVLALLAAGCDRSGSAASPRDDLVQFVWSGAVTPTSAVVNARLLRASDHVRLVVSSRADLGEPLRTPDQAATPDHANVVSIPLSGLRPDTQYHYAVEADGKIDAARQGRFRTFPNHPASFAIAFASCAQTGSNHPVFDTIRERAPLLFLHMGDFHYENISRPEPDAYRRAYEAVLASPRQSLLYRSVPIAYIWDDHDFGGNDSDRSNPGRRAARMTYEGYVPHYPLAAGQGDVPIYHAFTIGRVRFLLTDLRSERSPERTADGPGKSMLGPAQKAWLEREMLAAYDAGQLVAWVSTDPWIEKPTPGSDRWGGYSVERREIADFIAGHHVDRLVMLSGDGHMLAMDDGSHADYSSHGGAGQAGLAQGGALHPGAVPEPNPFRQARRPVRLDGGPGRRWIRDLCRVARAAPGAPDKPRGRADPLAEVLPDGGGAVKVGSGEACRPG